MAAISVFEGNHPPYDPGSGDAQEQADEGLEHLACADALSEPLPCLPNPPIPPIISPPSPPRAIRCCPSIVSLHVDVIYHNDDQIHMLQTAS